MTNPEIECRDCDGHGFICSPRMASGERECDACGGEGWRPMTFDGREFK